MNTAQQDSAMSVLCKVIIFYDFSLFFVYHRKSHSIWICLAPWELFTQELTGPSPSPSPCRHRNQFMVKRSLPSIHLWECQKVQNGNISLTYSLATPGSLQKNSHINRRRSKQNGLVCPSHKISKWRHIWLTGGPTQHFLSFFEE